MSLDFSTHFLLYTFQKLQMNTHVVYPQEKHLKIWKTFLIQVAYNRTR